MDRLVKFAKGFDTALVILRIILIVALTLSLGASLYGILNAPQLVTELGKNTGFNFAVNQGVLKLRMTEPELTPENFRMLMFSIIVTVVLISVLIFTAIWILRGIINDMKEGRPFSQNIPNRIRKLAYVVFAYATIVPAATLLPSYALFRFFDFQRAFSNTPYLDMVQSELSYSIDAFAVFTGLAVILLSFVFEYGAKLQLESDHTL